MAERPDIGEKWSSYPSRTPHDASRAVSLHSFLRTLPFFFTHPPGFARGHVALPSMLANYLLFGTVVYPYVLHISEYICMTGLFHLDNTVVKPHKHI